MQDEPGTEQGYYRFPTVHDDRVVFVSEDDLWEVPLEGGRARRLTTGRGRMSRPYFSPDGSRLAFTGTEEGATEIHVMDAAGGPAEQLTFNGSPARVVGWHPDGERILFRSTFREPFRGAPQLYSVPASGGEVRKEKLGTVHAISFEPDGDGRVLARNEDDLARWKRYRGGRAGELWVDPEGGGEWERILDDEEAGLVRPMWIGDRIYFVSDMEGYGNLYSCTPQGDDRRRHTDHTDFYVRFASTDGRTIVYTCAGRLYAYDAEAGAETRIEFDYPSSRTTLNRRFVDASDYLESYRLHPEGHSLAITARGKLFNFGNWEGAVRQNGRRHDVRYRSPSYIDEERILAVSDEGGESSFEVLPVEGGTERHEIPVGETDFGRPTEVAVSPEGEFVAFANHRQELWRLDLEGQTYAKLDESDKMPISDLEWSPGGRWLAYARPTGRRSSAIRIADPEDGSLHDVTSGEYRDVEPVFDPEGRYLYFLSCREFNPVYDQVFFELSFPRTMKPCVVTLTDEEPSLFFEEPHPLEGTGGNGPKDEEESEREEADEAADVGNDGEGDDAESEEELVEIDFDGMNDRVEAFPVREAEYRGLAATEKRVFWSVHRIEGSLGSHWSDEADGGGTLKFFSLEKREEKNFAKKVTSFRLGPDRSTMAYESRGGLRVVNASGRPPAKKSNDSKRPSRESGWIDLNRVPVAVRPRREWEQMLHESWRLMRDHYWREDMGGVDWDEVWTRYSSLLDRISTRSEFSDLIWTMQGELGTSHAYELGGDYERPPQYRPGYLGVDAGWDDEFEYERDGEHRSGGYRIDHIVAGENWQRDSRSPLHRPGVDVEVGDVIVAVDGERLDGSASLQQSFVHRAGEEVEVTVAGPDGEVETHTVELLRSETKPRYREWVRRNRDRVHEATDGAIGYIHIPDMGPRGYSEFHRAFSSEQERDGLIVDVRYNGGGHVSQLILEKLARETIGYDRARWRDPLPYPSGSIPGPMVALTNEYAGSDGDIFSHCFKLMDLGPLLGTRTWGGVVGIWPRHRLVDGSITTQPEFASWFEDVGFGLENRGTEPDEVVEKPPGAATDEADPQLDAAIEKARELLEKHPPERPELETTSELAPPEDFDG